MKRICLILFLILFSNIEVSKANLFNNFTELNPCISGYNNFSDYKSKLQTCYEKKGIEFDKEIFNSLSKETNVIKDSGFNLKKYSKSENILCRVIRHNII